VPEDGVCPSPETVCISNINQIMSTKIHVTPTGPLNFLCNFLANHKNQTSGDDKKHLTLHIPSLWGSLHLVHSLEGTSLLAHSETNDTPYNAEKLLPHCCHSRTVNKIK